MFCPEDGNELHIVIDSPATAVFNRCPGCGERYAYIGESGGYDTDGDARLRDLGYDPDTFEDEDHPPQVPLADGPHPRAGFVDLNVGEQFCTECGSPIAEFEQGTEDEERAYSAGAQWPPLTEPTGFVAPVPPPPFVPGTPSPPEAPPTGAGGRKH